MNDPYENAGWSPTGEGPYGAEEAYVRAVARRRLQRRLQALLVAGIAAFALCTWFLVTQQGPLTEWLWSAGPSRVVRSHLEALNRGEPRAAYALFSVKYREEIPLAAYERMVASHRDMFRSRQVEFSRPAVAPDRTVVETRLLAANGRVYVARFTLVLADGRWWIDRVRWSDAPDPSTFTRT
jgi:hypothetical protein